MHSAFAEILGHLEICRQGHHSVQHFSVHVTTAQSQFPRYLQKASIKFTMVPFLYSTT